MPNKCHRQVLGCYIATHSWINGLTQAYDWLTLSYISSLRVFPHIRYANITLQAQFPSFAVARSYCLNWIPLYLSSIVRYAEKDCHLRWHTLATQRKRWSPNGKAHYVIILSSLNEQNWLLTALCTKIRWNVLFGRKMSSFALKWGTHFPFARILHLKTKTQTWYDDSHWWWTAELKCSSRSVGS